MNYELKMNEEQAKKFVGLLDMATRSEKLAAALNAVVAAPSAVALEAKSLLDLVKEVPEPAPQTES